MWRELPVATGRKMEFVEITGLVRTAVTESGVRDGLCLVYVPHTTAGVTINENADPDVTADLQQALATLVPRLPYRHAEGNSPAHLLASLIGSSVSIPIIDGRPALGTWQGVYFAEFDGPRRRRVLLGCQGG